jgi:predicted ArsR family transcriptional regulator
MTPLRDDILAELHKGPLSAKQAAAAVGTKYQYALAVLNRLCELGIVRRRGFSPPPKPGVLFELCQPHTAANPRYAQAGSEA